MLRRLMVKVESYLEGEGIGNRLSNLTSNNTESKQASVPSSQHSLSQQQQEPR